MRLRHRIFATYIGISLAIVGVGGAILYRSLVGEAREGIEQRLSTGVRMLAVALAARDAPADPAALDARVDAFGAAAGARMTVVAPDGTVVADSEFDGAALAALDDHGGRAEVIEARARGEGAVVRYSRSLGVDLVYRARRVDAGPWAGSVVRMAVPASRVATARRTALARLAVGLGAALALAVGLGAWWARRLTGPIEEMGRVAARIRAGDLEARARVDTGDELEDLAATLNGAAATIADRIAAATAGRNRLEAVLEGMVEGVVVTDRAGRVVLANEALRGIFGLERPVRGRTVIEGIRDPDVAEAVASATVEGGPVTREIDLRWPAPKTLTLHAVALPDGGAVGVFHDVTELKRAAAARREFVANVSHELQTPLATVSGYAETLADPAAGPDEVRAAAGVIRRHVARLSLLVGELLHLSRLEDRGFEPVRDRIDVASLVAEVAGEWRPRVAEAGLELAVEAEPGTEIRGDPRLLRQALGNLLENAVKYCPAGASIRVSSRSVDGRVELAVADTGPGIPAEHQGRLFERFYRVEKGRGRETGGTGLGLAIVKHVAEVHGGGVSVESRPGAGSTFRIVLPAPAAGGEGAAG